MLISEFKSLLERASDIYRNTNYVYLRFEYPICVVPGLYSACNLLGDYLYYMTLDYFIEMLLSSLFVTDAKTVWERKTKLTHYELNLPPF